MSDIVERLRDVSGFVQKERGRVAAAASISEEAADIITTLRAELERKDAALRAICEGDIPRPVAKPYRADGTPSKNDQCEHGQWMYEECGQCIEQFARAALRAGLAAWPRSRQDYDLGEWSLILPLPQEKQT